jgi:O-antigen/teichoic acid export membrane protein
LLSYGIVAMSGALIWEFGSQVSAWFVKYHLGLEKLGVYGAFRQMSQLSWGVAGMAWGLLFSHVANLWESRRRAKALRVMNLSYKLVVLVMMTATVLVLVTAPAWTLLLRESFRRDLSLLAGLLMFYQCSANLGMAGIVAQLRERPAVTVLLVSAAVLANAGLAWAWVPHEGMGGAAQAAGIASFTATLMGVLYMLMKQPSLHVSGHLLALSPIILLLPGPIPALLWGGVLIVVVATRLVFSRQEKVLVRNYVFTLGRLLGSRPGDRATRLDKALKSHEAAQAENPLPGPKPPITGPSPM